MLCRRALCLCLSPYQCSGVNFSNVLLLIKKTEAFLWITVVCIVVVVHPLRFFLHGGLWNILRIAEYHFLCSRVGAWVLAWPTVSLLLSHLCMCVIIISIYIYCSSSALRCSRNLFVLLCRCVSDVLLSTVHYFYGCEQSNRRSPAAMLNVLHGVRDN